MIVVNSIVIMEEVKRRLKAYNLSAGTMRILGLSAGWQEAIPDIAIQIIVEQTQNIIIGE